MNLYDLLNSLMQFAEVYGEPLTVATVATCFAIIPIYIIGNIIAGKVKSAKVAEKRRAAIMRRVRERRLSEGGAPWVK